MPLKLIMLVIIKSIRLYLERNEFSRNNIYFAIGQEHINTSFDRVEHIFKLIKG